MAIPIYDIAAISTNANGDPATSYGTMSTTASTGASNTVSQQLANLVFTQLTNAGWTELTAGTTNTRTWKEFYGLQSPWYDEDNVPSWYTENIPWVRVDPTPSATQITFRPGRYNGTIGTDTAGTAFSLTLSGATGRVHSCWANPFQMHVTDHGNIAMGYVQSCLHIPDFVQERSQVKNAMFATSAGGMRNSFVLDNITTWTLYESNLSGGKQAWQGDPNLGFVMVQQIGGGLRSPNPSGYFVWNPIDVQMGTETSWWPMICPPTVAWVVGTGTPASTTNTPTAIGMLWDSLIINRPLTMWGTLSGLPETPTAERRNWVVLGSSSAEFDMSVIYISGLTP